MPAITSRLGIGDWGFGFKVFGFGFGDLGLATPCFFSSCWRERTAKLVALQGDLFQSNQYQKSVMCCIVVGGQAFNFLAVEPLGAGGGEGVVFFGLLAAVSAR